MSEYFDFVNHDKRLRFPIGFGPNNIGRLEIGLGPLANRALCLLISGESQLDDGSNWRGDRIEIIGDESNAWTEVVQYRDIRIDILMMLAGKDGADGFQFLMPIPDSQVESIFAAIYLQTGDRVIEEILNSYEHSNESFQELASKGTQGIMQEVSAYLKRQST